MKKDLEKIVEGLNGFDIDFYKLNIKDQIDALENLKGSYDVKDILDKLYNGERVENKMWVY